jgi:hypothetical protein
MEERECFPKNFGWEYFGWEFGASFRLRIPFMAKASRQGEMHQGGQSGDVRDVPELIDLG